MRRRNSDSCHYYERRINNEVAAGEFAADRATEHSLKNSYVTSDGKKSLGIPENIPLTMYEVLQKSIDILPRIRFIYLLSLLEAFFKDYLCERETIDTSQIKTHLKNETSKWSQVSNNESTSFYHIPYVLFLVKEKYCIDIISNLNGAMLEAGTLRNCIVHHDGKVVNQYVLTGLQRTASYQQRVLSLNDTINIDKKIMALYIEQARKIIALFDY